MLRVGRACARLQGAPARGDRWASGRVRAHVAPPAARQLSSAVHLSTVGGLGCAATRPESVEGAAAARTRSHSLRRHPDNGAARGVTLTLRRAASADSHPHPSHCRPRMWASTRNVRLRARMLTSPNSRSRVSNLDCHGWLLRSTPSPQTPTLSPSDSLTLASMLWHLYACGYFLVKQLCLSFS